MPISVWARRACLPSVPESPACSAANSRVDLPAASAFALKAPLCSGLMALLIHLDFGMARLQRKLSSERGSVELTCSVCGTQFWRPKAHVRGVTTSCSRRCALVAKPKTPPTLVSAVCKECGAAFQRAKHRAGKMQYCSPACRRKGAMPKGSSHPNWKGGIAERAHATRRLIKEQVRKIGACQRCGGADQLQGHHIRQHAHYPELRTTAENIEVLCAGCHADEHPTIERFIRIPRQRFGITIACVKCGTQRYVRPSLVSTAKFCSSKCRGKGRGCKR